MIDTHSHMFADAFEDDRAEAIERALQSEVDKIILPNIDSTTIDEMLQLHHLYPQHCYPTIGLHPTSVKENYREILEQMQRDILDTDAGQKIVAIGETGLDYYWDTSFAPQQQEALKIQLEWSEDYKLPIILHTRESTRDTLDIIKKHDPSKVCGVFHCFSGTPTEAQEVIDMGFYIGIGGTITYKKNNMREWLEQIPLSSVVLETDSPYLSPVPHRGKRNESSYLPLVAQELSELYDLDVAEITKTTTENALKLFGKIK